MVIKAMKTTLLHLTDNSIDDNIYKVVKKNHLEVAGYNKIICVSQKPVNGFGKNICIGEIGRSWMSLYKAILAGLKEVETDYICIIEHDCLYSSEHVDFVPPDENVFYYNSNHWIVQWSDRHPDLKGMYSYWPKRHALSQLVCSRDLLEQSTKEIMRLLDMGLKVEKGMKWYGEPGLVSEKFKDYCQKAFTSAVSGRSKQLQSYLHDYITNHVSEFFKTEIPNLDIRHDSNFTGPKRGKKRTFNLYPWGPFKEVMEDI